VSRIVVSCPECKRDACINGRGKCRCGAYLVHHSRGSFTMPDRTWFWDEGASEWFAPWVPSMLKHGHAVKERSTA
jgi:hypothetical protein